MASTTSQTTVSRVPIVLTGQADWDNWFKVTKNVAVAQDIWTYVNPDTSRETLPVLLRPTQPLIPQSSSDPDNPIDLYRIRYQRYTADMEKYKTLQLFMTRIQETISTNVLSYTINCDTAYDMLVKLKVRFAPTDKTRRAEMLVKYRKIQKAPRNKSLEPWLHEWEMIYHNAVELNLPNVAEDRAIVDFLRSIQDVNPGFYTYWIHHTEATDIYPTLYEIIQKFRTHIR